MKKPQKKILNKKLPIKEGLDGYFRKLIAKTFHVSPKSVAISKANKQFVWKAKVKAREHVKYLILKNLSRLFSKNHLRLLDGKIGTSFSKNTNQINSLVEFTFKQVRSTKSPKLKKTQVYAQEVNTMNKTVILANSLSHALKLHAAAEQVNELIKADDNTEGFKVLRHGEGARDAMQTFQKYVSDKDYTNFLPFMRWYDDGLYKFRGNVGINLEDLDDEDDDDIPTNKRGKRGKKSFAVKGPPKKIVTGPVTNEDGIDSPPTPEDNSVVISKENNYNELIKQHMYNKAKQTANKYYNQ